MQSVAFRLKVALIFIDTVAMLSSVLRHCRIKGRGESDVPSSYSSTLVSESIYDQIVGLDRGNEFIVGARMVM